MSNKRIILASSSPRRIEILKMLKLPFEKKVASIDEDLDIKDPKELVKTLALAKAKYVFEKLEKKEEYLVIGADTIVVIDEKILGKPKSYENAYEMLLKLSGRFHSVFTAIAIVEENKENVRVVESKVKFKKLSSYDIESYLKTDEWKDKAGSYAVQGLGAAFIEKIDGCYFNVMGLSVVNLVELLKEFDFEVYDYWS